MNLKLPQTRIYRKIIRRLFVPAIVLVVIAIPTVPALAVTYGDGTYGSCQYNACSITITSDGTVSVNVVPTSSGACTIQNDTVSVLTDDSGGYLLQVANSSTNTGLLNGSHTITSSSASQSSPSALVANTWGYRVDGVGGFGAGPTSAQSNTSLNSTLFAQVPPSNGTPDTIANTSVPADPAVDTSVWYSVCADTSVSSGTYSTQVTYTAVAN